MNLLEQEGAHQSLQAFIENWSLKIGHWPLDCASLPDLVFAQTLGCNGPAGQFTLAF
jgi:hypothetical protein